MVKEDHIQSLTNQDLWKPCIVISIRESSCTDKEQLNQVSEWHKEASCQFNPDQWRPFKFLQKDSCPQGGWGHVYDGRRCPRGFPKQTWKPGIKRKATRSLCFGFAGYNYNNLTWNRVQPVDELITYLLPVTAEWEEVLKNRDHAKWQEDWAKLTFGHISFGQVSWIIVPIL